LVVTSIENKTPPMGEAKVQDTATAPREGGREEGREGGRERDSEREGGREGGGVLTGGIQDLSSQGGEPEYLFVVEGGG